ncbi:hypothetical protein LCGC14_1499240 [marine sediment metagenome]|uniref:Uncharacterized protein n=1 Tax=marine sediment metagenome TaxID=412755 RepID=A0A0F9JQF5_9ZZZZ
MEAMLNEIMQTADHQIPYYAYGDNQAACDMSHRLETIYNTIPDILQEFNEKQNNLKRFGKHDSNCNALKSFTGNEEIVGVICTCGFTKALMEDK